MMDELMWYEKSLIWGFSFQDLVGLVMLLVVIGLIVFAIVKVVTSKDDAVDDTKLDRFSEDPSTSKSTSNKDMVSMAMVENVRQQSFDGLTKKVH